MLLTESNPRLTASDHAVEQWAARIWLISASLIYLAIAVPAAAWHKAFWYDELFTYYIAARGSVAEVWQALLSGMDHHPPVDYTIRHLSMRLFGASEFSARLPSIVAIYAAFLALFAYVRRAHSLAAAVCASAFFLMLPWMTYAVEARGYALTLAIAATALLAFRRVLEEPQTGWLAAVGLGACLGLAVWTHYYGVVLLGALAIAIAVFWHREKRAPAAMIGAAVLGTVTGAGTLPFVAVARNFSGHFWIRLPGPAQPLIDIVEPFQTPLVFLLLVCAPTYAAARWLGTRAIERIRMHPAELAWLLAILFSPVMQWGLGLAITGAYLAKYTMFFVLPGCAFLGIMVARLVSRLRFGSVLVAGAAVVFVAVSLPTSLADTTMTRTREAVARLDTAAQTGLPIVSPHANNYLRMYHYGTPEVRRALVFLSDRQAAVRLAGTDTNDRLMTKLAALVPIRVERYSGFVASNPRFLLSDGRYDRENWLPTKLAEDGFRLTAVTTLPGIRFECSRR